MPFHKTVILSLIGLLFVQSPSAANDELNAELFTDDFSGFRAGLIFDVVGAHTEYHYLSHLAPRGKWAVSSFKSDGSQRAWRVLEENGARVMYQSYEDTRTKFTHPMLVAGDALWKDYRLTARFAPDSGKGQSGIIFRYRNDRCYYFFGVNGPKAILKMVRHATAYHKPFEKILAEKEFSRMPGAYLTAVVEVEGSHIRARLNDTLSLEKTYAEGKIALMSDIPTRYKDIRVTTTLQEKRHFEDRTAARDRELARLQAANPRPVVWKKASTEGFGVGRNRISVSAISIMTVRSTCWSVRSSTTARRTETAN
ncbi:MAG: LamG domain-containing protein [Planctomycetota bacterium]|jgi:hypothetical protein